MVGVKRLIQEARDVAAPLSPTDTTLDTPVPLHDVTPSNETPAQQELNTAAATDTVTSEDTTVSDATTS